jgi:hypothetical protein
MHHLSTSDALPSSSHCQLIFVQVLFQLGLYASMVSVIASVLIYIVLDDSQLAIYVGLWAPTLILYSQAYEQANK